jgi:hypothetical protein
MKKSIIFIIMYLTLVNFTNSQIIPASIKQKIETLKKETKTGLDEYRTYPGHIRPNIPSLLSPKLSWKEELLADSLKLNLHIRMIYDDEMRDRIVQLMRNGYREDELDTLVNRRINNRIKGLETETLQVCKLDTMHLFKVTLDSFYINLPIKDMSKNMYKHDILTYLQLDTMRIFKQTFNIVRERERERESERESLPVPITIIPVLQNFVAA